MHAFHGTFRAAQNGSEGCHWPVSRTLTNYELEVAVKLVQVRACCSLTSSVSPSTSVLALC